MVDNDIFAFVFKVNILVSQVLYALWACFIFSKVITSFYYSSAKYD